MNIILRDYESVWHNVWPNFMVQWFCLISWRLFDVHVWTSYFGIMSQYDTSFDLKINVGHSDLYFMIKWFCLNLEDYLIILKTIWYMNTILWDCKSVWLDVWPQDICRSLWPIFHGLLILPYILKTVQWQNIILWDYESVWPNIWPQNIWRSLWPIYFMVHWINLTSWRLFDVWTLGLWVSMTQYLTSK